MNDYYIGTSRGWGNFLAGLREKAGPEFKGDKILDRVVTHEIDPDKTELRFDVEINGIVVQLIMSLLRFKKWKSTMQGEVKLKQVNAL
jgi:hypothetical protein